MSLGAALALACALVPNTAPGLAPGPWRALFATASPLSVDFWSVSLDGRDRRPVLKHDAFGDESAALHWSSRDPGVPTVWGGASADGRWLAYRLDASPARAGALWLANVETGQVRLVATNVERFRWSSQGARLLYSLAPPPPAPMEELHVVEEGRAWRLHTPESGNDTLLAGPELGFVFEGPWPDSRRMLFWRSGVAFDQITLFDAERHTVREGRTLLRRNILEFGPRPGLTPWAVVTTELGPEQCIEARDIDAQGRFRSRILLGCSYVCAGRGACLAWRDERTLVVARSEAPDAESKERPWWGHGYHPVSLITRDVRTGKEERLLDGSPSVHWALLGSLPGQLLLVKRSYVAGPWIDGGRRDCELQARTFDGLLLGTLHRGEDPPAFVGFVR